MVDFFDETVGWPLDTGYMSLVVEQKLHDKWKFIVDVLEGSLQEQFKVKSGDHKLGPVLIDTGLVKLWPVVSGDGIGADMIWNNSATLKSKEEEVDCFSGATPTVIGSRAGVEAGENTSFFLDAMAAYVSKVGSS